MQKGLLCARTAIRVNFQQTLKEVEELSVLSSDSIAKRGLFRDEDVIKSIFLEEDEVFLAEVVRHLRASLKHPLRPRSKDALHAG